MSRINDGKMQFLGLEKVSKVNGVKYFMKFNKGMHYKHRKIVMRESNEFHITNPEEAYLCLDGEVFQSSDVSVKLVQGGLNLMGVTSKLSDDILKFRGQTQTF
jgi:diacylglycerol kinase family enzyme